MKATIWEKFLDLEEMGHICRYNETVTGLSPLDRPGTEAYFSAVLAAMRREASARLGFGQVPPERPVKKPEAKTLGAGWVFSGQLCYKCDRRIEPGEKLFAIPDWPAVVCAACQPNCEYQRSRVQVRTLAEWESRPFSGKRKNYCAPPPVLVPVVAV